MSDNPLVIEAAKFLKDAQEEAWSAVKDQIQSADNVITFNSVRYVQRGGWEVGDRFYAKLSINGKVHEIDEPIDNPMAEDMWDRYADKLRERIGKVVSGAILSIAEKEIREAFEKIHRDYEQQSIKQIPS